MCDEYLPLDKIMSKKLLDSLQHLFQIWGCLYAGKLRPKFTRWMVAFVIDQPSYLLLKPQFNFVLVKSQQLVESRGFFVNPEIENASFLTEFLAC